MFYDRVDKLCHDRGIKITRLARDLQLGSGAPNRWQKGSVPHSATLQKIADYFDVSVDYLISDTPAPVMTAHSNNGSAVIQGGVGNNASVSNGNAPQGLEAELLRVFARLNNVNKAQALSRLYELEAAQDAAEDVRKAETDGATSY